MKTPLHVSGRGYAMAVTLAIAMTSAACSGGGNAGRGNADANQPGSISGNAGSAPNGATATPTTAPAARPGVTTSAAPTGQSAAVSRLLQRAHSADRATYTVTYRATLAGNAYPPAVLLFIDGLTPMVNRSLTARITTRTVLGHKVDCATFVPAMRNPPPPSLYCVRPDGVLAYSRTSDGQILELTGFQATVNARDLIPPR